VSMGAMMEKKMATLTGKIDIFKNWVSPGTRGRGTYEASAGNVAVDLMLKYDE